MIRIYYSTIPKIKDLYDPIIHFLAAAGQSTTVEIRTGISHFFYMNDEDINTKVTLQHIGKCCKCGRKLTDPKSIELGIGPECAKAINY